MYPKITARVATKPLIHRDLALLLFAAPVYLAGIDPEGGLPEYDVVKLEGPADDFVISDGPGMLGVLAVLETRELAR